MRTRKRSYTTVDKGVDKELKTSAKVTKILSNVSPGKAKGKSLKDKVELIKEENCRSLRKANIKKSETDVKQIEKNNNMLSKQRGRKPNVKKTTLDLKNTTNGKKSKPDIEENHNRVIKTKERKSKADVKIKKKVSDTLQSKGKGKKSKPDIEIVRKKNYTLSRKPRNEKPDHDAEMTEKMVSNSPRKEMGKVLKVEVEMLDEENYHSPNKIKDKVSKTKNNMENKQDKDIEENEIEILEDDNVEFLEEKNAKVQDNSDVEVMERNVDIQETLEANNAITSVSDDDNDHPDEITFCSSRDDAMENMKLIKNEINKIKNERKEVRKKIHDRNILQKKQKIDKAAELQNRKLPPQILEYISKLPKIEKHIERGEINPKVTSLDNSNEGEDCKQVAVPRNEDFISLHGSTEFRACFLDNMIKKPKSLAATAAEFKQQAFSGNKVKRESEGNPCAREAQFPDHKADLFIKNRQLMEWFTKNYRNSLKLQETQQLLAPSMNTKIWEFKSKIIKQAAAGKL